MESFSKTFHLGKMTLGYTSELSKDGKKISTTYVVDDDGFIDPNSINIFSKDHGKGPNNELGGTPYDYEPVKWTETYDNPGYKSDNSGKPLPIEKSK